VKSKDCESLFDKLHTLAKQYTLKYAYFSAKIEYEEKRVGYI